MPANLNCQICETYEAAHVCFTCVNPVQEINVCGGVLICASCKLSHHNSGIFLLHQTTSLEARYKRRLLQGRIKGFQLSISETINNEIVTLNVRNAVNKTKLEASRMFIHKQLMEVYNAITSQLNAKEKDLNKYIESNFRTMQEEADACRNKLKELSSTVAVKSEALLTKLMDENEEADVEKIEIELEELERKVRSGLSEKMENKLGPYVKVDRGSFEADQVVDIKAFNVSHIDFYKIDEMLQSSGSELFGSIEEGTSYVIPSSLLTRAMLNQRQAMLNLPHPLLVKHGLWVRDAIEYYIQKNFEQNQFPRLADHELLNYNNKSIVLVKSRAQDHAPPMMRCRFALSDDEEKSKGKRMTSRSDKAEVSIYPVDHHDLPVKSLHLSKVYFYRLDPFLEKAQLLVIKAGFNASDDSQEPTFPELAPNARKKIQKALETGKEMYVCFKKKITTPHSDSQLWTIEASIDGVGLSQLVIEGEEAEPEKSKPQLCKDIRLQGGGSVPVIREMVGESAAKAAEDKAKELSKEPAPTPTPELVHQSQLKTEAESVETTSRSVVKTREEVVPELAQAEEAFETASAYDCLEANYHFPFEESSGLEKAGNNTTPLEESKPLPANSKECLKLLVLDQPQLAASFHGLESSKNNAPKTEITDEFRPNLKKMAQEYDSIPKAGLPNSTKFCSLQPSATRSETSSSNEIQASSISPDLVNSESWLEDTSSPPIVMTQQNNANNNQYVSQSMLSQEFVQPNQLMQLPCNTNLPNQMPHLKDHSQANFLGPQAHLTPPPQLYSGNAMGHPTTTLDDPSRRTLSYLALVVYGEQSLQFQNSTRMEEPTPHVKRGLYEQIQSQQAIWKLVPRELLQPLMDIEMKRFPVLNEEFRRFGVPMNIYRLPIALGSQLNNFLERNPELKKVLKMINYETPHTPQEHQPLSAQYSSTETRPPVQDHGGVLPGDGNRSTENQSKQSYQSQISRSGQDYPSNRNVPYSKHGDNATMESEDVDRKPLASDCIFNSDYDQDCYNLAGSSSQSSNYRGESGDWGGSQDNGWVEDEDVMSGGGGRGRSDSQRSYGMDKPLVQCSLCGLTGHLRSECPNRSQWNRRDQGRDSGWRHNNHNRRNDTRRSRTGGPR